MLRHVQATLPPAGFGMPAGNEDSGGCSSKSTPPRLPPGWSSSPSFHRCSPRSPPTLTLALISIHFSRETVYRLLSELADCRGVYTGDSVLSCVDAGLTDVELAACLGTAREVLWNVLKQLEREGLVRLGTGRLVLLDLSRFEETLRACEPAKKGVR